MSALLLLLKSRSADVPVLIEDGLVGRWDFGLPPGTVDSAPDLSGNGNHLNVGSDPGADANDPVFTGDYATFTAVDPNYCEVDFAEVGDAFSIIVVANATDTDVLGNVAVFSTSAAAGNMAFLGIGQSTADLRVFTGASTLNGTLDQITEGAWHVFSLRCAALGALTGEIDGVVGVSGTGIDYTIGHLTVGSVRGTVQHWEGHIAIVLVFNRRITDDELTKTRDYLRATLAPRGITLP